MTHVGIIALAFHFHLWLPFGAIAVSWKWIYIRSVCIMIQLHAAEGNPEGTFKVVLVIRCVLEPEALLYASHVMSK